VGDDGKTNETDVLAVVLVTVKRSLARAKDGAARVVAKASKQVESLRMRERLLKKVSAIDE
jgi:uncharacterized protein YoxC